MRKNWQLVIGSIFILLTLFMAFVGPYLPFVDTELSKEGALYMDDGKVLLPPFPPSEHYWLGSDRLGVDLLSRIIMGTKEMLLLIIAIVLLRYIIAIPLGLLAFYYKWAKSLLDFINHALSFVPIIFLVIFFVNLPYIVYSPNRPIWFVLVIAFVEVGRVADVLFKQASQISQKPFIEAAISTGNTKIQLLRRYYFPILMPNLIVSFTLDLGRVLFIIGQLGLINIFISHKIEAIAADSIPIFEIVNTSNAWPLLFESVLTDIFVYPWIPFSACLFITIFILGFNVLGEGFRKQFIKKNRYL